MREVQIKAKSQEQLHSMAVDLISLAARYVTKHPKFSSMMKIDHGGLRLTFGIEVKEDSNE